MTETINTIAIPLNRLVPGTDNVRRTGRTASIGELTASILAHGLRQNLNVRAADAGRFAVVAGGRRLRALKQLAKDKHLPKDYPVPCRVLADDEDAGEISLAENVCRVAMHPADQFEAFHDLVHVKGLTVEQVAGRFGVETSLVEKRLKLAAVHPKLFAAYRKGELTLECLMAFTVSEDAEAQLRVWQEGRRGYLSPQNIRRALTEGAIAASHRLARFVGEEAYAAAGGVVMRDLFDDDNAGFFTDSTLVMRLATEKLDALAEQERGAGWLWVKAELETDYGTHYAFVRSGADEEDREDEDGSTPAEAGFTDDEKARSGVRIRIGHDGAADIVRGLVQPEALTRDYPLAPKARPDPAKGEYPSPVVQDLTAHRTAALRVELAKNPAVALAMTVHALALPLLYRTQSGSCLNLSADSRRLDAHANGDCSAHGWFGEIGDGWRTVLPESAEDLLAWCLVADQTLLLDLLAYLAALSLDALKLRHDQTSPALTHADRLAEALSLDMTTHWRGSVDGFFGRLSKAALTQAVVEAKVQTGVAVAVLKKAEAARHVASALTGTGWLPVPPRVQAPAPAA